MTDPHRETDKRAGIETQTNIDPRPPAPADLPERDAQIGDLIDRLATLREAEFDETPGNHCWKHNPDARLTTSAGSPATPIL